MAKKRAAKRKRKAVRRNPVVASLPRGKWVNAKVRVTKSGKIQAKIPKPKR